MFLCIENVVSLFYLIGCVGGVRCVLIVVIL